ncbi:hypothetical protein H5410_025438 [Solanum commersonii]|uniref:Uncharacterized protein n=1 Tax=Solanum commersonii TaxID=4109 RepID=A0A9J5YU82_SOLCO|nr:hypothetical protein H5410_025438 [Solanum commersonii]
MENTDMDLDNIKSNLLALRQLYGLLRNDRDGVSNLNSDGLDHEARLMLKNLLDTTTNDVLKAHSEIIAHQAHVHNLPQHQHLVDTVKQHPLALLDMSKSSAVIQSCGNEPVVMEEFTLSKEKQESIVPVTETASVQRPKFRFSASETGKKRKFCRICQRPKFEKTFVPCINTKSSEIEASHSTKIVALQEQQNSLFGSFSRDIQQEALQSVSTESRKPKEVLDLHCISSGAETVSSLSDRPSNDPTQSVHNFTGLIRSVPDQNHDHLSTDDVIKQLELRISALQMDAEDLVLADRHAADQNFKLITNFVPQVELASPIKKIEGVVVNDKLDSLQLVITQYSQEPKGTSSSLYPGYTIPSIRISNISADQSSPPESSSCQSNQLRQQQIVANIIPAEHRDMSTELDLVEEHPLQIQRGNIINHQSDQFEPLGQLKNQNNSTSRQNPYAALPAMLVNQNQNQNQNQMPSNEKIGLLGKLNAARQMPAADISRNNIGTPGLIDHGSKLTWSSTNESRMDSPYSEHSIMRRSALNHKLGQFKPSRNCYANLDQNSSKYPANRNLMKQLRRRHLHEQESEVSHSSSPYSSCSTDLQQTSTYSSDKDDSLPRQARTKTQYSDETSSYGEDESYPRRDSSQTDYTVSSSCSGREGNSSPIGSERAHESKGERSSSLDPSGSDHLEELSYYSADSSSRRSSPARPYKSANSKKSKKHNGRWKKLKDKLAIVFHHHHHHHHHHHGKDDKAEEKKTSLLRQRGKRFPGHYSSSKDETYGEKTLEKFGKSAIDKQAGKKPKGDQFHTLARGLMQHIQHSKKSKHSSSRPVDKEQHSNKKVINKFRWWQLLRHHRGMNKSPAMLGSDNKKHHQKLFPR